MNFEKVLDGLYAIHDEAYDRWVHTQYCTDKLVKLIGEFIPDAIELLKKQEGIEMDLLTESTQLTKKYMERCKELEAKLNEREPVKPKKWVPKNTIILRVRGYYCPICNTSLSFGDKYCHECGRRINWDE